MRFVSQKKSEQTDSTSQELHALGQDQESQSQKRCEDLALNSSCWSNSGNGLADTTRREPEKALDPPGFVEPGERMRCAHICGQVNSLFRFQPQSLWDWQGGRTLGEGNSYPLQCSCLENPMDRGAWRAMVRGVEESDMTEQLSTRSSGVG